MSSLSRPVLWQRLQNCDLVEGTLPALTTIDSPWYVRVMLGVAGWLGSFFLFGFVGLGFSFVMQSAVASLLVGAFACGGSFALFKRKRKSDFSTQFGLAVGLAGQMLLIFGIGEFFARDGTLLYVAVLVVEVLLTIVMPNFICRVMTSLAATIALAFALNSAGIYGVATGITAAGFALVWMQDVRWAKFSEICRPLGYGLALSLLFFQAGFLWGQEFRWLRSDNGVNWLSAHMPWLDKALVVAVFLAVVLVLLKRLHIAVASGAGLVTLGLASLIMALSFQAPGIAPALLIVIVGFAVCNRLLVGVGLLALGGFLANYYYMMQSTLLEKAILLLCCGAVLLGSRLLLRILLPAVGSGGHADA